MLGKIVQLAFFVALIGIGGCGDDDNNAVSVAQGPGDDVGYGNFKNVVVMDKTPWVISGEPGEECIDIQSQCIKIKEIKRQQCGDPNAQVDIVLSAAGKVLKVICYPSQSLGVGLEKVAVGTDGQITIPQKANNTVITFDEGTNGKSIKGNVELNAEKMTLMGNGVDKTIIEGNLNVASNEARLRGFTVTGNVTLEKNSNATSLAFCKIKGNLTINSNNVAIVNCQVFGKLQITGNGSVLINVGVAGELEFKGIVPTCENNYVFQDRNSNFIIESDEIGADITCE